MIKQKKKKNEELSFFYNAINKTLITGLITVICLIGFKKNNEFKTLFNDKVLGVNFNFVYMNDLYKKYLGGVLPFNNLFQETQPVFNEKLNYKEIKEYLDGVSLSVSNDYLVPSIDSGLVVFVGNKNEYGNTVIIQNSSGVDIWYSNMDNIDVKMYEYIPKGRPIGNCHNNLTMVFKKDGNILDYQKYI